MLRLTIVWQYQHDLLDPSEVKGGTLEQKNEHPVHDKGGAYDY